MWFDFIILVIKDIQPGRLVESLIFLGVLLWRLAPHLKKMEDRMLGVEDGLRSLNVAMTKGFDSGTARFESIESRLEKLENQDDDVHSTNQTEEH